MVSTGYTCVKDARYKKMWGRIEYECCEVTNIRLIWDLLATYQIYLLTQSHHLSYIIDHILIFIYIQISTTLYIVNYTLTLVYQYIIDILWYIQCIIKDTIRYIQRVTLTIFWYLQYISTHEL